MDNCFWVKRILSLEIKPLTRGKEKLKDDWKDFLNIIKKEIDY
jgi:hypothetical protein